jgi:hypothetical protein
MSHRGSAFSLDSGSCAAVPPNLTFGKMETTVIDGNLVTILELACQTQRVENIVRGRKLVGEYIASKGIETVETQAFDHLFLDDDWEFRRLAEIYIEHSQEALARLVDFGLRSENPEVVEAANDFKNDEQDAP